METTEVKDDLSTNGDAEDTCVNRDRSGIQSIEVGSQLLVALTRAMRAMTPDDLTRAADMHPSKVHRYLVGLQHVDAVSRNPLTSRYELGPFAFRLGPASFNRSDAIARTRLLLAGPQDQTGYTIGIAVWNDRGPTVMYWEKADSAPGVNLRIGDVLLTLNSATG